MDAQVSAKKIVGDLSTRTKVFSAFGALVILLLIGVVSLVVWKVPQLQVAEWALLLTPNQVLERENQARANLIQLIATFAQVIGGAVLLMGLYFTWRNIKLTELTATKTLEIAQHTLRNSQTGQITERFTKAIEQLGKIDVEGQEDNLAIRLGGIYALERLAKDSPEDQRSIIEILTTYIREKSPWRTERKNIPVAALRTDLQTILNVLSRRSLAQEKGDAVPLNLKGVDLRRAHLERANLTGAILNKSHLEGAELSNAILEKADLTETHLEGADLAGAILKGADFNGAYLDNATLIGADLQGAYLEGCSLLNADLHKAKLAGAHIEGADLSTAINLTREQITLAISSTETRLPKNLRISETIEETGNK